VVVGGTWSTRTDFERAADKLRYASPFEVLAVGRNETDVKRLGKLSRASGYVPGMRDRITALRTGSFPMWRQAAVELDRVFGCTPKPELRARLQRWLDRDGD
jgi:hypothetical protein